jgi:GcrA cell cycle regulator
MSRGDKMGNEEWTKDYEAFVLEKNANGWSAQEISVALGKRFKFYKSRNAVIGKIFRILGRMKAGRKKPSAPPLVIAAEVETPESPIAIASDGHTTDRQAVWANKEIKAAKQHPTAFVERVQKAQHQAPADLTRFEALAIKTPDFPLVQLMDLKRGDCHWPYGTPGKSDFGYCGCKAKDGGQYCAEHQARMGLGRQPARKTAPRPQRPQRTQTYEGRFRNVQY